MKKRKLKKKILRLLILIIAIIVLISILYINSNNHNNTSKSSYSSESINIITKNKLEKIYEKEYSKTLDEALKNNDYNLSYIDDYLVIKYIEKDEFIKAINTYLKKGYTGKEINNIFKLSNLNQEKLLITDKIDFSKFISINNYDVNNNSRYIEYIKNNPSISINNAITYVNINLDKKAYSDTKEMTKPDDLLVLVNKYNYLPSKYKPNDLVYVQGAYGNQVPFRNILKEDFIKLQKAAKEEININLMPTTAYRDEAFQTTLYNKYVKTDGKEKADTYSARPGYSEHQTGLAIDLKNMALSNKRLNDSDYEWLSNNAHKYGFIIRYPKDKENITGYQFENWHIRYVGIDNAKIIYENKLTLEEYIDLYITKY